MGGSSSSTAFRTAWGGDGGRLGLGPEPDEGGDIASFQDPTIGVSPVSFMFVIRDNPGDHDPFHRPKVTLNMDP